MFIHVRFHNGKKKKVNSYARVITMFKHSIASTPHPLHGQGRALAESLLRAQRE